MTDPGGAGRERERPCGAPVYEDHLTFLRDLVRDGERERVSGQRRPGLLSMMISVIRSRAMSRSGVSGHAG